MEIENTMKLIWKLLICFLLLSSVAEATDISYIDTEDYIVFDQLNTAYINLTGRQNFSELNFTAPTLQLTINSSTIQFNSTTNKTISNITFNNNTWNLTYTGAGTLKINASTLYKLNYTLYKNGVAQSSFLASANQVYFDLTSADSYSIQVSNTYELLTPLNNSININPTSVTFTWSNYPISNLNTIQIATDSTFLNIVSTSQATSATGEYSTSIPLSANTDYYWRIKNATSSYGYWYKFTTTIPTSIPGSLNITVKDEQTLATINNFTAQVYNSTLIQTKSTTTGWTNFSSSEVVSGEYFIRIIPAAQTTISTTTTTTSNQPGYVVNTSGGNTTYPNISSSSTTTTTTTQSSTGYATRFVLATSPSLTDVIVYLPSMSNTINTIAFYLLDYSSLYPFSNSTLTITKNNTIIESSYFDAEAKVTAYLIQGDNYGITIRNGNNINNWGNYVSVSSGSVNIVITNIAVNATSTQPFNYNLSYSTNDITLSWTANKPIISLNFTVLKNNTELVHQIITTVPSGQSTYIVTDLNSTYYVYITEHGSYYMSSQIINYQKAVLRTNCGLGQGCIIGWGTGSTRYNLPLWMYNNTTMFLLWILAGSFGALFAGFGAIIALFLMTLFTFWGWFNGIGIGIGTGIGIVSSLVIIAISDYIRNRE